MAIAIAGSGPAGCYTADMLARALPGEQIDIFERQQEPYGLVRYGVAPDHAGTKAVAQLFGRTFKRAGVQLHTGVEIGKDISIEELEGRYRAVVIATGAGAGRLPVFPGASDLPMLSGLDGAALFNGMDITRVARLPARARSIVIMGNGNVSLDMARLFARPAGQLASAGVPEAVVAWREGLGLQEIHIIGRGNAAQTKFGYNELRELGSLAGFRPVVELADLAAASGGNAAVLPLLEGYAREEDARLPVYFHFGCQPTRYAQGRLELATAGGSKRVAADLCIAAIGQLAARVPGLPFDEDKGCIPNHEGLVAGKDKVFVVGWAANPGGGSIPASRQAAAAVVQRVLARLQASHPPAAVR